MATDLATLQRNNEVACLNLQAANNAIVQAINLAAKYGGEAKLIEDVLAQAHTCLDDWAASYLALMRGMRK